jgi:hypothetical protein
MMRAIQMRDEIARYLEEEIADKKQSGTQAELFCRQPQILVHRQRGESDIGSVEIADDVAREDKRKDAAEDLRQSLFARQIFIVLERTRRCRFRGRHRRRAAHGW